MRLNKRGIAVAAAAVVGLGGPLVAQTGPDSAPTMQDGEHVTMAGMSANHEDMIVAMKTMDRDMMGAQMTGDPDRDLVTMMMPHHQGAIDMARIYLRDGKDPAIRAMAEKIIVDQEREIGAFKAWLAAHPATPK